METLNSNKRVITLLRHGEAVGSPDLERQLTPLGQSQSRSASKALLSLNAEPDFILCSDTIRTRQTLEHMNLLKTIPVIYCGYDLYKANTYKDVLNIIAENTPDTALRPLIIGHNPTIHETVLYLSRESRGPKFGALETSYPTGTATLFDFHSDDWNLLHPSTCKLTHILSSL